jgi:hypothetical protein
MHQPREAVDVLLHMAVTQLVERTQQGEGVADTMRLMA